MTAFISHQNNWTLYRKFADESLSNNNYDTAETLIELALKEAEYLGRNSEKYIATLQQHAEVLFKASKLQRSIETYTDCLKLSVSLFGEQSLETALIRCKLADVCISFGTYARAKDLFLAASNFFKSSLEDHSAYLELVYYRLEVIKKRQQEIQSSPVFYSDKQEELKPVSTKTTNQLRSMFKLTPQIGR